MSLQTIIIVGDLPMVSRLLVIGGKTERLAGSRFCYREKYIVHVVNNPDGVRGFGHGDSVWWMTVGTVRHLAKFQDYFATRGNKRIYPEEIGLDG